MFRDKRTPTIFIQRQQQIHQYRHAGQVQSDVVTRAKVIPAKIRNSLLSCAVKLFLNKFMCYTVICHISNVSSTNLYQLITAMTRPKQKMPPISITDIKLKILVKKNINAKLTD